MLSACETIAWLSQRPTSLPLATSSAETYWLPHGTNAIPPRTAGLPTSTPGWLSSSLLPSRETATIELGPPWGLASVATVSLPSSPAPRSAPSTGTLQSGRPLAASSANSRPPPLPTTTSPVTIGRASSMVGYDHLLPPSRRMPTSPRSVTPTATGVPAGDGER